MEPGYVEIGVLVAIVIGFLEVIKAIISKIGGKEGDTNGNGSYLQLRLMSQSLEDLKERMRENNVLLQKLISVLSQKVNV